MSVILFDQATHTYRLDSGPVGRSVTGVLYGSGLIDFSGIPEFSLEAAKIRGTVVHQAIHYLNERDLDLVAFADECPQDLPYVEAWQAFCDERRFVPILNEHRVAARSLDVAGTIDCLGVLDGKGVLLDFATGNPADVSKDLQTAGYLVLAHEWRREDPALDRFLLEYPAVQRYAVALRKDGTFRLERYADPADLRAFITLAQAQRIVSARRRRVPTEAVA